MAGMSVCRVLSLGWELVILPASYFIMVAENFIIFISFILLLFPVSRLEILFASSRQYKFSKQNKTYLPFFLQTVTRSI